MTHDNDITKTYASRPKINAILEGAEEVFRAPDLCNFIFVPYAADADRNELLDWQGMNLRESCLNDTEWRGTRTIPLDLTGCWFDAAIMARVQMKDVLLHECGFQQTRLFGTLDRVYGQGVDLTHADLSDLVIKHSTLEHSSLFKARMRKSQLLTSTIMESVLDGALLVDGVWTESMLFGNSMRSVNGSYLNLSGTNLRLCDLSFTDLTGANLVGANLDGTNLAWTTMTGVLLGPDTNMGEKALAGAQLSRIKIALFSLLADCERRGKRERIVSYVDLFDREMQMPDIFSVLDMEPPIDTLVNVGNPLMQNPLAVKRFFAGMVPILDKEGRRHPLYNDQPFRLIIRRWIQSWLETPKMNLVP